MGFQDLDPFLELEHLLIVARARDRPRIDLGERLERYSWTAGKNPAVTRHSEARTRNESLSARCCQ